MYLAASEIAYASATFLVLCREKRHEHKEQAVATLLVHIRGCIASHSELLPPEANLGGRKLDKIWSKP